MVVPEYRSQPQAPRVLLAYFSHTGRVQKLACGIGVELANHMDVVLAPIQPVKQRPSWNWLALSFVPGSRVALEPFAANPLDFDLVCLGLPKWTVSCPPVNQFLRGAWVERSRFAAFVCYGGFDEVRYLQNLTSLICRRGGITTAAALFRRRDVDAGVHWPGIVGFCSAIRSAVYRAVGGDGRLRPTVGGNTHSSG